METDGDRSSDIRSPQPKPDATEGESSIKNQKSTQGTQEMGSHNKSNEDWPVDEQSGEGEEKKPAPDGRDDSGAELGKKSGNSEKVHAGEHGEQHNAEGKAPQTDKPNAAGMNNNGIVLFSK